MDPTGLAARPERRADVAVVGAGPAGAAAAITLARSGHRVVMVDKAVFPRDKCCGDGLTTGALRRLEALGLRTEAVASFQRIDDVRIRIPRGTESTFPLPDDGTVYAAAARRADLDAALVDVARAAGVEVVEDDAVTSVAFETGGRVVRLGLASGHQVRAWYAVGADGMWSPLRKALGADQPGYLGDWHAVRQYFTHTGPEARHMWVWFEPDLIPGYVWSFPLPDGGANVGYGIHRQPGKPTGAMKHQWGELLARPHIRRVLGPDAVAEAPWKAWPIPTRIGRATLTGGAGRVLFVGDAVRAGDTLTGEGIAQALETAASAAGAIHAAGPDHPA
ncbi:MAG: NAD(P)/FAD-dependent oxidoreductase, partial [Acidimicrobiales bacterium]